MQIEKLKIEQLIPSDYNPRKDLKPGDAEYDKLKRSIEQFGYVEPVIWNKTTGRVVGGHQRLKVLIDMGITEVECVVVELPETKEKALNVALNKISGDWDKDIPIETGVFSDAPPKRYLVITPMSDTFELYADNIPNHEIQEARLSLFDKASYTVIKNKIVRALLNADITITDRRYIGHEDDTGFHHYAIDVAKYYVLEE